MSDSPGNDINLHHLVWHPDDFRGDQFLSTAFRRSDLIGGESHISVSRIDRVDPAVERETARRQAEKANGRTIKREEAYSIQLNCGEVRAQKDDSGNAIFSVIPKPTCTNPAHCGIQNISGKTAKGGINHLRTILVKISTQPEPLEDFLQKHES